MKSCHFVLAGRVASLITGSFIPVTPGATVVFSAWGAGINIVQGTESYQRLYVAGRFYAEDTVTVVDNLDLAWELGTFDWTKQSKTVIIPEGASYFRVSWAGLAWTSSGEAWLDDFYFGPKIPVKPVGFNGVNLPVLPSRWVGKNIGAELMKLKGYGFNTIRISIYWRYLMPSKRVINESYFTTDGYYGSAIDKWVNWCTALRMNCILTIVMNRWFPPPEWAFPSMTITDGGKQWDAMMSGEAPDEVQSIKDIWAYIADRYKSNKWVAFDVFNEPRKGVLSDGVLAAAYKSFIDEVVDGIRAKESLLHKVIVEWYINVYVADNITKNVIRSDHYYNPWEKPYDRSNLRWYREDFGWRYDLLSTTGLPVMVGEFGRVLYPTPQEGSEDWFNDVFTIFREFGVKDLCVHNYSYSTDEEYSIINPDGTPREPFFSIIQANMLTPVSPLGWILPIGLPIGVGLGFIYLWG